MTRIELAKELNTQQTVKLFANLYSRWQCEKEFEDINDYLDVLKKTIPQAYKILKRPFSIICKCDDGDLQFGVKLKGKYLSLFAKNY